LRASAGYQDSRWRGCRDGGGEGGRTAWWVREDEGWIAKGLIKRGFVEVGVRQLGVYLSIIIAEWAQPGTGVG
jgi:hypothetical protein